MYTFRPTDSFCTIFLRVYILRCLQKWRDVHLRDEEREKYSTSADSSQQKGKTTVPTWYERIGNEDDEGAFHWR